jgi:putative ABC transport system ATP-binding protein
MLKLFEDLNAEGLTLIVVTHEQEVAERARRRISFRDGRIVSDERRSR